MSYPSDLKYTKEHEWVRGNGASGVVGITDHAQKELGDIVYVDLPRVGTRVEKGKTMGSVESVKAVSDVYAPVSGEVAEVNDTLANAPEKLDHPLRAGRAGGAAFRRRLPEIHGRGVTPRL
jgi:glycine cleavage system H protein